jgi:hypothetical protein
MPARRLQPPRHAWCSLLAAASQTPAATPYPLPRRDAHQSLLATRMRTHDMLKAAGVLDRGLTGL